MQRCKPYASHHTRGRIHGVYSSRPQASDDDRYHSEHAESHTQDDHTSVNPQTPWKRSFAQTAGSQSEANAPLRVGKAVWSLADGAGTEMDQQARSRPGMHWMARSKVTM